MRARPAGGSSGDWRHGREVLSWRTDQRIQFPAGAGRYGNNPSTGRNRRNTASVFSRMFCASREKAEYRPYPIHGRAPFYRPHHHKQYPLMSPVQDVSPEIPSTDRARSSALISHSTRSSSAECHGTGLHTLHPCPGSRPPGQVSDNHAVTMAIQTEALHSRVPA